MRPGSSLQAPKKSRDEQTELAPGPFDSAIVNHLLGGFVCLFLDRRKPLPQRTLFQIKAQIRNAMKQITSSLKRSVST